MGLNNHKNNRHGEDSTAKTRSKLWQDKFQKEIRQKWKDVSAGNEYCTWRKEVGTINNKTLLRIQNKSR